FAPAGAHALTPDETRQLMALFDDNFLTGGQAQPRAGKWVNENVFVFLQGDKAPAEATTVRYVGIGVKGVFCQETQPTTDFPHYRNTTPPAQGPGVARRQRAATTGRDEGTAVHRAGRAADGRLHLHLPRARGGRDDRPPDGRVGTFPRPPPPAPATRERGGRR